RTGDASDANTAIVQDQEKFELGRISWARVDASGTPEETYIRARVALELDRQKICIARAAVPPTFPLARAGEPRHDSSVEAYPPARFSPMSDTAKGRTHSARHLAVGLAGYCAFINLYSPQSILPLLSEEFHASAAEVS